MKSLQDLPRASVNPKAMRSMAGRARRGVGGLEGHRQRVAESPQHPDDIPTNSPGQARANLFEIVVAFVAASMRPSPKCRRRRCRLGSLSQVWQMDLPLSSQPRNRLHSRLPSQLQVCLRAHQRPFAITDVECGLNKRPFALVNHHVASAVVHPRIEDLHVS